MTFFIFQGCGGVFFKSSLARVPGNIDCEVMFSDGLLYEENRTQKMA